MASRTSSGSSVRISLRRTAGVEDEDAVAGLDEVGGLGADQQHAHAVLGGPVDGAEQVGAGADVDGLGRLVEHEQDGLDGEPLGEEHLLLVAAAELLDQVGTRPGPDATVAGSSRW